MGPETVVGHTLVTSKSNEWYTPSGVIESARLVLGEIDLDPASCEQANLVVRALNYYTKEDDGLGWGRQWRGRVWLNPPYGRMASLFTRKLLDEYMVGRCVAGIVLVNSNALGARWGQMLWDFDLVCSPRRRIHFLDPLGASSGSTHGSLIGYVGPELDKFVEVFSVYGRIVKGV